MAAIEAGLGLVRGACYGLIGVKCSGGSKACVRLQRRALRKSQRPHAFTSLVSTSRSSMQLSVSLKISVALVSKPESTVTPHS
jgi:hypothetical protein